MKILLADPPAHTDDYDKAYPNLGILQLISYLRDHTPLRDQDIVFLDQFHTVEDHLAAVEEHQPAIYGISFAFLTQRVAYRTINAVKQRYPDLLVIAGGPHPTAAPEEVLGRTAADLVCIGEGETLLADVVNKVLAGDHDFTRTPGLALRPGGPADSEVPPQADYETVSPGPEGWHGSAKGGPVRAAPARSHLSGSADSEVGRYGLSADSEVGRYGLSADSEVGRYERPAIDGKVVRTGPRPVIEDLDSLPYLAWERIDFSKFVGQHYCKSHRQSCIVISRGCPYRCTFCSLPVWRAAKPWVRLRSPQNIAAEVDWLYSLGVREIKIVSDEINVALPWAKAVCRAIADLGHKDLFFQSNLRADKIDDELARLFKRMNMWLVHLGVESANDRVLAGIEKHITVAQSERCLALLEKHRIRCLLFMMAFNLWEEGGRLRHETPAEVRRSLWWAWKQFLRGRIAYTTWSLATPMPGARLHDIVTRHGLDNTAQVLDNWDRNKDYLGIDLTPLGISERTRMRLVRLGIVSKALFMIISGRFDWRRHFYRVGILVKTFFGNWAPRTRPRPSCAGR